MITVERFQGPPDEWDQFVRSVSGWTHFHLYGWRTVMERVFHHECCYLVARSGDAIVGVLPLVRVKSALFGHYLVSMPFVNYGGPLGSDEAIVALTEAAERQARQDRVKLLELRSRRPLPVALPVSTRKITVVLDLPSDAARLMKQLDAKVRSQVR